MKYLFAALLACAVISATPSCSKDNNEPDGPGNSMSGDGDYGKLGDNMVATGGTRAVSYTQGILLGTVDFMKLDDTHTFGVVYMEAVQEVENQKPFDYNLHLRYNEPDVEEAVVNTTSDGKFEKQLVDLMPGTTYYYRSYIKIGKNYNYADVKSFSTKDPSSEINLVTGDAEEVCALSTMLVGRASIGNVNNGLDQAEIRNQDYGFIYSDDISIGTPETLTMEYWENWDNTHFDTQKKPDEPETVITEENINSVLRQLETELIPGTTYYYRTVFIWNGRYFYSPDVKSFTTLGPSTFTVGTLKPENVGSTSAMLKGHIPFEKIGAKEVDGGFMISKKYSNRAEFVMKEDMSRWPSYDDISYVECNVSDVDFMAYISGLEPDTQYYVCAFIDLGREKDTVDKYGDEVPGKKIYLYGDVISFTTEEKKGAEADINIYSTGDYPWYGSADSGYTSGNSGIGDSVSTLTIEVQPKEDGVLSFDWTVDSEPNYDKLQITVYNGWNSSTEDHSGTESDRFSMSLYRNNSYRVEVRYSKDGSGDNGADKATVRNISFN